MRCRRGFTLIELLVSVTIIGILAALVLGAVHVSREAARKTKTRTTIRKIDGVVTNLYDSYRTRRVPIAFDSVDRSDPKEWSRLLATARLTALRDVMRMEMPDRWADVATPPVAEIDTAGTTIARSALSMAYVRMYERSRTTVGATYGAGTFHGEGPERLNRYSSAECLYMIVSMAGGSDARDQFHENEIGDADSDGLPEFQDGWGNPIMFLRWAPGLVGSPLQAQVFFDSTGTEIFERDIVAAENASGTDHDPFDSRNLHEYAYRLVPYIYSAGPDGIYDINFEGRYQFADLQNPYFFGLAASPDPNEAGIPVDSRNSSVTAMDPPDDPTDPASGPKRTPDSLDSFDNIDNHQVVVR